MDPTWKPVILPLSFCVSSLCTVSKGCFSNSHAQESVLGLLRTQVLILQVMGGASMRITWRTPHFPPKSGFLWPPLHSLTVFIALFWVCFLFKKKIYIYISIFSMKLLRLVISRVVFLPWISLNCQHPAFIL